jgi:hypothetical protein
MGKRSAVVELLLGNMGSMQWEIRPSMQREDQPTMATKLEQIAVKVCDTSCVSRTGSCKNSQHCEPTTEEPGAGNLHAGFCGNGGRVAPSRDPVRWETGCWPVGPKLPRPSSTLPYVPTSALQQFRRLSWGKPDVAPPLGRPGSSNPAAHVSGAVAGARATVLALPLVGLIRSGHIGARGH